MRALVLEEVGKPLCLKVVDSPKPKEGEVLIKVEACGVCRTDLHILDGELNPPHLPLILGHQIVGRTEEGTRVGVPWLGKSCGSCFFCKRSEENLCDAPEFTGFSINGGFAEECIANRAFIFPLNEQTAPEYLAPLLCAGMIGYRTLAMAGDAKKIGFYGFGASAHLLIQLALFQKKEVFVFTKEGDTKGQEEARKMGALWAGSSKEQSPELLDAALIFAPVGELVPVALQSVRKGGQVISAGIHMSDIPSFPYHLLWGERIIRSVANLTRKDGEEFLALAQEVPIKTAIATYPLEQGNEALADLRSGKISGSAVLIP